MNYNEQLDDDRKQNYDNLEILEEIENQKEIEEVTLGDSLETRAAQEILDKLNRITISNEDEKDPKVRELIDFFDSWESEDFLHAQLLLRENLLQRDYELINELRTEYELGDGVINVLIYYTIEETQRFPRLYITKVAKNWIDNDITTTRLAVKMLLKINRNRVKFVSTMRKASNACQEVLKLLEDLTPVDTETQELMETIKQRLEAIGNDLQVGSCWED